MEYCNRVIALGFFDGVHVGHAALLRKTVERANELGATPAVISFDNHPVKMITGNPISLINSPLDRADLIRRLFGINDLIFLHFDNELMHMSWQDFIKWLIADFGATHLVAGYDFRFGYKGEGNSEKLLQKCGELGIGCDIIPKVCVDGIPASSTYIRELLIDGKLASANKFLGHLHFMSDIVRSGYRFGRTLGTPTINMRFEDGVLIPRHGVYAAEANILDTGECFEAVTNIGVRPTVGGEDAVTVESHLLGYSGNLYGKKIRVDFHRFLRPEMHFENVAQLRSQISRDASDTQAFFNKLPPEKRFDPFHFLKNKDS